MAIRGSARFGLRQYTMADENKDVAAEQAATPAVEVKAEEVKAAE